MEYIGTMYNHGIHVDYMCNTKCCYIKDIIIITFVLIFFLKLK